jgi:5-methylthioadenosine/S-adenosylhomocysteine deaminase
VIRLRAEWVVPVAGTPIADGSVVINDRHIVAVGPTRQIAAAYHGADEHDLGSVALTPGFVDAHCHVEWSLSPHEGPCTDGFAAWLARILRRGGAMQPHDFLVSARFGVASALLRGTTFILDAGPTGAGARAADELGMRAHIHLEAFGRPTVEEAVRQVAEFAPRVGALDAPRVRGGVSPHAPYTVNPTLWAALADHPDLQDRPWMTHLAESHQEEMAIAGEGGPLTDFFHSRGSSPGIWPGTGSVVARLAAHGALRPGLVAAHCVVVDDRDRELLRTNGVGVAHCPVSNADLGVGTHDLDATRAADVAVGFGSDSPATAGRYDVRAVAGASAADDPSVRLRLATVGGAQVAGRANELGTLEPGRLADLVAIAIPPGTSDPVEAVMDPAATVVLTMVDGDVVMRDGALVHGDLAAIQADGAAVAQRIGA